MMKNKNIRIGRDTILVKLIRFDIPLSPQRTILYFICSPSLFVIETLRILVIFFFNGILTDFNIRSIKIILEF